MRRTCVDKTFAVASGAVDRIALEGAKAGLVSAFQELSLLDRQALPDNLAALLETLQTQSNVASSKASIPCNHGEGSIEHAVNSTRRATHRKWVEQIIAIRDAAGRSRSNEMALGIESNG